MTLMHTYEQFLITFQYHADHRMQWINKIHI